VQETFKVPDVHCDHCKSAIEGTLQPLNGVEDAQVDLDAKHVTVAYDDGVVDRASVVRAIESAGYPVSA
jgi:copper chaperone